MNNLFLLDRGRFLKRVRPVILLLVLFFLGMNYNILTTGSEVMKGSVFSLLSKNKRILTGILTFLLPGLVAAFGVLFDYFSVKLDDEIMMPKKSREFARSKLYVGFLSVVVSFVLLILEYLLFFIMGNLMRSDNRVGMNSMIDQMADETIRLVPSMAIPIVLMVIIAIAIGASGRAKAELRRSSLKTGLISSIIALLVAGAVIFLFTYIGEEFIINSMLPFIPQRLPLHSILMVILYYPLYRSSFPDTKVIKREVVERINEKFEIMSRERALKTKEVSPGRIEKK